MRFMIFPYTQNSEGAIAIAEELKGQRILRKNSKYVFKPDDIIVNWGAGDCPYPQALNHDNNAVLNKLSFFRRLAVTGLTPRFAESALEAAGLTPHGPSSLAYPIFCRTRVEGKDGAGIVVADNSTQLVAAPLYVEGVNKTAEYRIHVGRLPDKNVKIMGMQKKIHGLPHAGQDHRVWTGESTHLVWTTQGIPVHAPPQVIDAVLETFEFFPELTFGAFDVAFCYNDWSPDRAYVLEINSAPLMTPETTRRYGTFFRAYAEMASAIAATAAPSWWPFDKAEAWAGLSEEVKDIIR